ncbi:MAG: VPLPA-CTERM sorting domain-containing protein [Spongiibacteraceae bacterium]|nr:VPLPA-CTERM sorting domain-containing protein [Spongiibacteraceae bacterium]
MQYSLLPLFAALLLLGSSIASAAVIPIITFTNPYDTVGPTDTIEVWVTLSLDPASDPLTFDTTSPDPLKELPESLIPTRGMPWPISNSYSYSLFADYTNAMPVYGPRCARIIGSRNHCVDLPGGGQYTTETNPSNPSAWFNMTSLDIQPGGDGVDILLYSAAPTNGPADPGHYTIDYLMIGFLVLGVDFDGNDIFNLIEFQCHTCHFSRYVSEVPVPAALWLFGSGLLGLAGIARKHKG